MRLVFAVVLSLTFLALTAQSATTASKPTVVVVADLREADAPCGCGDIIRLVRGVAGRGISVREVPPGGDRELIARHHVKEMPTVLVLDPSGAVLARYEGESKATIDALRAHLEKLAGGPFPVPPPKPAAAVEYPKGADVQIVVHDGSDVPDLARVLAPGRITVVDFYADWCGPCKDVERHLAQKLTGRSDIAVRKLNIVSWDSALAKHYVSKLPSMPVQVIFGKDGHKIETLAGLDLEALDRAIDRAAR